MNACSRLLHNRPATTGIQQAGSYVVNPGNIFSYAAISHADRVSLSSVAPCLFSPEKNPCFQPGKQQVLAAIDIFIKKISQPILQLRTHFEGNGFIAPKANIQPCGKRK